MSEPECDAALAARLPKRLRRVPIHRVPLPPAGIEDELRVLDVLVRGDVEARGVDEPATDVRRCVDLQRRLRGRRARRLRTLAEDVQQARGQEQGKKSEERAAHGHVDAPAFQLAVPLQGQRVRRPSHRE